MNIIVGKDVAEKLLLSKYTLLELDSFKFSVDDDLTPAFCVLELSEIDDLSSYEVKINLHKSLIESYHNKEWEKCLETINELRGSWSGDVDSFYDEMQTRVGKLIIETPEDWVFYIDKTVPA